MRFKSIVKSMDEFLVELEESILVKGNKVTLDHKLFSPRLRIELEKLIKSSKANLLILENFSLDYGILVANLFNSNWSNLPPISDDVFIAYPVDERWSIDALKSEVIEPTLRSPYNRHYIIVANSESIDKRGFDKLLKTFEEPTSPTTFLLLTSEAALLPKTILSRAQAVVRFTREDENFYFNNLGYSDQGLIAKVQDLAGPNLSLGRLLLESAQTMELAQKVFSESRWSIPQSLNEINQLESLIVTLACSWDKNKYVESQKLTTPAQRSKARAILNLGIEVYRVNNRRELEEIASSLSGRFANGVSSDFKGNAEHLARYSQAIKYNRFNVNLRNILLFLLIE